MSKLFDAWELLGTCALDSDRQIPEKYGILVDTNRSSVVVLRFFNHRDLLDLILSDDYDHLILYRTQYELPGDDELLRLNDQLFSE